MTSTEHKLPPMVSDYIHRHFREDFLFKIRSVEQKGPHTRYAVDVAKDEYIYHLEFDEKGWLTRREVEEAFPAEDYEDPNRGDSSEEMFFRG